MLALLASVAELRLLFSPFLFLSSFQQLLGELNQVTSDANNKLAEGTGANMWTLLSEADLQDRLRSGRARCDSRVHGPHLLTT